MPNEPIMNGLIASAVFGATGILLTLLGFKVFDWITPKIDVQHELAERQNIAVAIVAGSIIIGISIVVSAVVG